MTPQWTDLGPADLKDGDIKLRKSAAGARLVCLNNAGTLQVLDDRCPHEGYPLSQGSLRDGQLTCAWHNWKFNVCSGACTTGGDAVRHYPCRVLEGRLEADLSIDLEAEQAKAEAGIAQGLLEGDAARSLRDGLRLAELLDGDLMPAFAAMARDAAQRGPWGFGHELACLTNLLTWVDEGDLEAAEAFSVAATIIGERLAREPQRASSSHASPAGPDVSTMLETEDRGGAEASVRALVQEQGVEAATQAMLPFAARYLLGYGHGAIYLSKATALSHRLPEAAEAIMAAAAINLSWATRESTLPPWAATRRAIDGIDAQTLGEGPLTDRTGFEDQVLHSERSATQATLQHVNAGVAPRALLIAIAHAAAVRTANFDPQWAHRLDVDASVLDVSHLITYAEACLHLLTWAAPEDAARMAVLAAGFVGKLAAADATDAPAEGPVTSLQSAVQARDPVAAQAAARALPVSQHAGTFVGLRTFAAFEAFVRPIFTVHAIKGLEALSTLLKQDSAADSAYLQAFLQIAVPRWPERAPRRTAATARQFIKDGRPPKGLY